MNAQIKQSELKSGDFVKLVSNFYKVISVNEFNGNVVCVGGKVFGKIELECKVKESRASFFRKVK